MCNDLYWTLLSRKDEFGCEGIFIHVPPQETVPPPQAAEALRLCAETALA